MLCLSIAVVQSPFTSLACLGIDIRYLLNAWVIIHSYHGHVRIPSREPSVVDAPESNRSSMEQTVL